MSNEVTATGTDEDLPQGTEGQVNPTDETTLETSQEEQVENTDQETESENVAEETTDEVKEPAKKVTGFQKRIQKFEAKISAKEQELEYWKAVALSKQQEGQQDAQPVKPKLADFESVEDYVEAREESLKEQLRRELYETNTRQQQQAQVLSTYETKVREAAKSLPDWEDVMQSAAEEEAAPETVTFCLDSDIGPKIAYHLAKNPDEHERINKLSPMRRVAELGKLEDRLKGPAPAKVVTKAPPKLSEVKGNGTPVVKSPNEASSYSEWKALKEAQKAAGKAKR